MCIEIRTYYQACGHYRYQNTHHCHIVQRCTPYDVKMTMERTLDLPARPSHIPPGMLDCKMRRATRPVDVMCGDCTRATRGGIGALAAREEGGSGTHANSNANNSTPDPEGDDGLGIPVTPSRMTGESRSSGTRGRVLVAAQAISWTWMEGHY